jgi:hypothetical protein
MMGTVSLPFKTRRCTKGTSIGGGALKVSVIMETAGVYIQRERERERGIVWIRSIQKNHQCVALTCEKERMSERASD